MPLAREDIDDFRRYLFKAQDELTARCKRAGFPLIAETVIRVYLDPVRELLNAHEEALPELGRQPSVDTVLEAQGLEKLAQADRVRALRKQKAHAGEVAQAEA